jgi:hypothetical protein
MADYLDIGHAFTRNLMSFSEVMATWFSAILADRIPEDPQSA